MAKPQLGRLCLARKQKQGNAEMPSLECKFAIRQRVHVDGDSSITGVVTMIEWRAPDIVRYEVSWLCGGDAKFIIFDEWRLSEIDG